MNQKTFAVSTLLVDCLDFRVSVSLDEMALILHQYEMTGLFPYNYIPNFISQIGVELKSVVGTLQYGSLNGARNPNTGGRGHARFCIGYEGSFVLYVRIVKAYPLNKTHNQIKDELAALAEKYSADEYNMEDGEGSFEARFWWD